MLLCVSNVLLLTERVDDGGDDVRFLESVRMEGVRRFGFYVLIDRPSSIA